MGLEPYDFVNSSGTLTMTWAPHEDEPLRVARDLNAAAAALEDEYKMLVAAREVVVFDVKAHFAKAEGPDGQWLPMARSILDAPEFEFVKGQGYVEKKGEQRFRAGGPSHLIDSGAGMAGATARSSYVIEASDMGGTITFSATPPHFMLEHNKGLPERETHGGFYEGPNPLPQREWMWLSEGAGDAIFQLFEDFVDSAVAIIVHPTTGVASILSHVEGTAGQGMFQNPSAFYHA